jgi:hypothetical protein
VPGTVSSGSFQVTAPAGCAWTAQSLVHYVTATGSGSGGGIVNFSIENNNGAARGGIIRVGGQSFTINQAGLNCTYTVTPAHVEVPRGGITSTVTMNTQPGCTWYADDSQDWIILPRTFGTGTMALTYTIAAQPEPRSRFGAIQFFYSVNGNSLSSSLFIDQSGTFSNPEFDFDGNGKANLVVFRPSEGRWYVELGENNVSWHPWGLPTDKLVPADYDGNGRTDLAVFRPSDGKWYISSIGLGSSGVVQFGTSGDIPVPADYDGDGRADIAVYRPSEGLWYIRTSSD